jgi:hypothetical protein
MKHDRYEEWIYLSLIDEISDVDRGKLENHLLECEACRAEFHEMKQLLSALEETGPAEPSEELLWELRRKLGAAVREAHPSHSLWARLTGRAPSPSAGEGDAGGAAAPRHPQTHPAGAGHGFGLPRLFGMAAAGLATLALGIFVGYLAFGHRSVGERSRGPAIDYPGFPEGTFVSNVRVLDWNAGDGMVELLYDVVRPVRLRADMEDRSVQNLLAFTLENERNPGVRLSAINAIEVYSDNLEDVELKQALIQALISDPNAGVRKQALNVLQKLPFDDKIKKACLEVLKDDTNPGLRVAAMNTLTASAMNGLRADSELYEVLKTKMRTDDNEYIRIHSGTFIQEVEEQ